MVRPKHKSKRLSTRQRVKIERKVKEHHKKIRKESKKNLKRSNKRKDPGIPKNIPGREEFISKVKADYEREELHKTKQKLIAKKLKNLDTESVSQKK